jgi:hypothetical protein
MRYRVATRAGRYVFRSDLTNDFDIDVAQEYLQTYHARNPQTDVWLEAIK